MDLSMPIMDGPTSARHIVQLQKEKKVGKHLKIVAVTAYDSPEHKDARPPIAQWRSAGPDAGRALRNKDF